MKQLQFLTIFWRIFLSLLLFVFALMKRSTIDDIKPAAGVFAAHVDGKVCLDEFDSKLRRSCMGGQWEQKYYFDQPTSTCQLFWYDGCISESSRNLFDDLLECQWLCEQQAASYANDKPNVYLAYCMDTFDEHYRDECEGGKWKQRFYYDKKRRKCTAFWYDGCAGSNKNFFDDETICEKTCDSEVPTFAPTFTNPRPPPSPTTTTKTSTAASSTNKLPVIDVFRLQKPLAPIVPFPPAFRNQSVVLFTSNIRTHQKPKERATTLTTQTPTIQQTSTTFQELHTSSSSLPVHRPKPIMQKSPVLAHTQLLNPFLNHQNKSMAEAIKPPPLISSTSIVMKAQNPSVASRTKFSPATLTTSTTQKLTSSKVVEGSSTLTTTNFNICDRTNPCQNGGTCVFDVREASHYCNCAPEFTNDDCSERVDFDPCASSPCQNGGTCAATADPTETTYECFCTKGHTGRDCELRPCDGAPCKNGGTCRTTRSSSLFFCECPRGWGGRTCDFDLTNPNRTDPAANYSQNVEQMLSSGKVEWIEKIKRITPAPFNSSSSINSNNNNSSASSVRPPSVREHPRNYGPGARRSFSSLEAGNSATPNPAKMALMIMTLMLTKIISSLIFLF